MLLKQVSKPLERRTVRHTLAAQINAHEATQRCAVEQRFFTDLVCRHSTVCFTVVRNVSRWVSLQNGLKPSPGSVAIAKVGCFIAWFRLLLLQLRTDNPCTRGTCSALP